MNEAENVSVITPHVAEKVIREAVHPSGHGRYSAKVTQDKGVLVLTLKHVERRWLPLRLFGRVAATKMIQVIAPEYKHAAITNDQRGLVFRPSVWPNEGGNEILGPEWPMNFREEVREQIDAALHGKMRGLTIQLNGLSTVVIVLFLLYAFLSAISGGAQAHTSPAGRAAAPVAAAPLLSPAESEAMSSSSIAKKALDAQGATLSVAEALAQVTTVPLRQAKAGGGTIVVWSDPLCPHCRDFEQKVVAKLPPELGITLVPVSFKHGSRPLVSYVACGATPAEGASRWKNLMSEQPNLDFGAQCANGPEVADRNTSLFLRAGLTATPTVMTPEGKLFDGDTGVPLDLSNWIAAKK